MTCAHSHTVKVTGSDERFCTRCQAVFPATVTAQPGQTQQKPPDASQVVSGGKKRIVVKPPIPTEHEEQVALFLLIATYADRFPELRNIFAVPNGAGWSGGFAQNAARVARARREGMSSGVPDIFVAIQRHKFGGTFIEMKRKGEKLKPAQLEWHVRLNEAGYPVAACYSCDAAWEYLTWYLEIRVQERHGEQEEG